MSDGTTVNVPDNGVVVFVGPNNAGKSQSLRDILDLLAGKHNVAIAVQEVGRIKLGTAEEFVSYVSQKFPATPSRDGDVHNFGTSTENFNLVTSDFAVSWEREWFQYLTPAFCFLADGATRLYASQPAPNIDFATQPIAHPLQRAYLNSGLESSIDSICQMAFGQRATVDRFGGITIRLRVGDERPNFAHQDGAPSEEYIEKLRTIPSLETQGDGIRSFLGLMLHVYAGEHAVLLIDEPEAFLHPPQARLLARSLAEESSKGGQIFLATHSTDIVQGVLEAGTPVTIVRLTRHGPLNNAAVLTDDDVKTLWSNSLLRYSNVFDGLFHDAVVLCEGDADCRYYGSVADDVVAEEQEGRREEGKLQRVPQVLFTHCGGKARLSMVVKALKAVRLPVFVIADFDVLRQDSDLQPIFEGLGGLNHKIQTDLAVLRGAFTSPRKPVSKPVLASQLQEALDRIEGPTVETVDIAKLRALLKLESLWDQAKKSGLAALPGGNATASGKSLLAQLKAMGLFVVPVGELERWLPHVPGHGPEWVSNVHARRLHLDRTEEAPRKFVKELLSAVEAVSSGPPNVYREPLGTEKPPASSLRGGGGA